METILRLYPSPEEHLELFELLQRLHPADTETFVQNLLPVSPVSAPRTHDTVVAASVSCGAVSANLPNFVCDSDDYYYGPQCDVDCSDYSDCDEPDELNCYSDVHDCVNTADYYAPTDVDFMHELHGPNNCGIYWQLQHEIRPYGHYALTDVEFYHGMHDPANYNPGPGTISPESGDMVAVSDLVSEIDPGPGEPLLQSGVSLNMSNLAGIDDVSQVPNYVSFGEPRSGTISPEFGITSAVSDLVSDIDPGPGEPLLQSGVSLNMSNFAGIDDVSQVPNYVSFGEPRSGTITLEFGNTSAMSDFVSDIDPGPGGPCCRRELACTCRA